MGRSSELYQEFVDQKEYIDEQDLWEITNLYIKCCRKLHQHKDKLMGTPHEVLMDIIANECLERSASNGELNG
jgi:hypothetical protein|tara:strand:+ start:315 stop:533 length:219 start_codon:yes stop_codon:yes gene_type:complete